LGDSRFELVYFSCVIQEALVPRSHRRPDLPLPRIPCPRRETTPSQ